MGLDRSWPSPSLNLNKVEMEPEFRPESICFHVLLVGENNEKEMDKLGWV